MITVLLAAMLMISMAIVAGLILVVRMFRRELRSAAQQIARQRRCIENQAATIRLYRVRLSGSEAEKSGQQSDKIDWPEIID